jgi:hypothetical protein
VTTNNHSVVAYRTADFLNWEFLGEVLPAAARTDPKPCLQQQWVAGANAKGADLRSLPQESEDPALCRAACCNDTSHQCGAWTLLKSNSSERKKAPCIKGRACCSLKSAAAATPVPDANAVASGSTGSAHVMYRPHVVFNAKTSLFVLW